MRQFILSLTSAIISVSVGIVANHTDFCRTYVLQSAIIMLHNPVVLFYFGGSSWACRSVHMHVKCNWPFTHDAHILGV